MSFRSCTSRARRKSCNSEAYFEAAGVAVPMFGSFGIESERITVGGIYRRIKVGTVRDFRTEASVRKGITGLIREINFGDVRVQATTMTVAELVEHYRQRELASDNTWKSYSTKRGYESYLKNWIVPH